MKKVVDDCKDDMYSLEILNEELKKSEEDIKAGRIINFEDFKNELRAKYNIQIEKPNSF